MRTMPPKACNSTSPAKETCVGLDMSSHWRDDFYLAAFSSAEQRESLPWTISVTELRVERDVAAAEGLFPDVFLTPSEASSEDAMSPAPPAPGAAGAVRALVGSLLLAAWLLSAGALP